jgi:hypothetical protein
MDGKSVVKPGDAEYESFFNAWQGGKGQVIADGYLWMAIHEDTYVKFVRKEPVGGFDKNYGQQSWPQSGREIKSGPFDKV